MTTDFFYRVALILPISSVEAGNRIAQSLGWGSNCYVTPLTSDGVTETHRGLSTSAQPAFIQMLTSASQGQLPEGVDVADVQEVLPVLLSSVGDYLANPSTQFKDLLDANGLSLFEAISEE